MLEFYIYIYIYIYILSALQMVYIIIILCMLWPYIHIWSKNCTRHTILPCRTFSCHYNDKTFAKNFKWIYVLIYENCLSFKFQVLHTSPFCFEANLFINRSKLRSQIGKLLSPAMSPPSDGGNVFTFLSTDCSHIYSGWRFLCHNVVNYIFKISQYHKD